MNRLFPIVTLAAAGLFPAAASAAPMTLQDAISYALNHNPTVAQQYAAAQSAEHSLAIARGTAYPTVNGSLQNFMQKNANYAGEYAIIGESQEQVFSQNTAQVGTNWTIDTGGFSLMQLASARASAAQATETLANTENQIASTVTNAFYNVVQKQGIVQVDASDLNYQGVLVDAAKAKAHAGMAAGVDVLRAQVSQAKSASTLVGARADVEDAVEDLAQTIGAPLDTQFIFPKEIGQPKPPSGTVDALEDVALNARPDVIAARDGVSAARFTRKGWDRELFPTVAVNASVGNEFAPTSAGMVIGFNPDGTPITVPRGSPGFWQINAQSTFTLPFVDWGQRHTERVNDDAQLSSAERALDAARTQVQIDVRQSYRGAQTALSQLSYAQEETQLGAESARVAQLQYQRGLIALSDVILAQQQSVTAQSDFVSARVSYVEAIVKLRVSLGTYTAQSAVADLQ
jgi:outer membrane protein